MPRRLRLPAQLVERVQHLAGFIGHVVSAEPSRAAAGGHLLDLGRRAAPAGGLTGRQPRPTVRNMPIRSSPGQALARLLASVIPFAASVVVIALAGKPLSGADDHLAGAARIIDGDTIAIGRVHVRLYGIDAPESEQSCEDADRMAYACGSAATAELRRAPRIAASGRAPFRNRIAGGKITRAAEHDAKHHHGDR